MSLDESVWQFLQGTENLELTEPSKKVQIFRFVIGHCDFTTYRGLNSRFSLVRSHSISNCWEEEARSENLEFNPRIYITKWNIHLNISMVTLHKIYVLHVLRTPCLLYIEEFQLPVDIKQGVSKMYILYVYAGG